MNEYDSGRISDLAKEAGYIQTEKIENIDCYVLNTCHIRDKATEKVYSDIGRLKKNYKNKKKPTVLITGCVAQAENKEMLRREPYIDAVIGPQSYQNLPRILKDIDKKKRKLNFTNFDVIEKFDKINVIKNSNAKVSSFITIQEGCDKFCNFCVVPFTRGPEYSRSPNEIFEEVKTLIYSGAKEITFLGQNVNAYKSSQNGKIFRLSDLIMKLNDFKEIERIRYTTSHPKDMSRDLITCYKHSKKLAPFVHLPVQTGSNKLLKSMNRKHTIEEYKSIIDNLKDLRPEINFSSDFIIGYPGETEDDFQKTIALVKEIKFINSFSFIYSPRPGTTSSKLKMPEKNIQKKRLVELQNILKNIQIDKHKNLQGKNEKILVENKLKNQNRYFGRSENLTPVIFDNGDENDIGKIISVRIQNYNQNSLSGVKNNLEGSVAA